MSSDERGRSTTDAVAAITLMNDAIAKIASYYKLQNSVSEAVVEAAEAGPGPAGENLAPPDGDTFESLAAIANNLDLTPGSLGANHEYVKSMLFSSAIGHLPAAAIVQLMENHFPEGSEFRSILAIQPHDDTGATDLANVSQGKAWPEGAVFAGNSDGTLTLSLIHI